ncbi:Hypothetical predicted protein [Mytilus galloprovincialis]|uniref:Reverse transcriptase domain-containing protein n=1 Tax=Mytilus galloprovincialis TaxID=29158 RepID=A0A8B6EUC2_MYTGA|nr:Hypothetical predicted protein [Mytilus galloprovincialis]
MDALSGSHPKMDWEATDLVTAWKSFQQHTEFWFAGPLAKTAEAQKCNYLMIWIGNKGHWCKLQTARTYTMVNSMVTVIKPNGKIRICIDPRDLNKAILREHYPLKTVEEVISQMPNAKVFSKLDATSGFLAYSTRRT